MIYISKSLFVIQLTYAVRHVSAAHVEPAMMPDLNPAHHEFQMPFGTSGTAMVQQQRPVRPLFVIVYSGQTGCYSCCTV
jgi:hypothetical protein